MVEGFKIEQLVKKKNDQFRSFFILNLTQGSSVVIFLVTSIAALIGLFITLFVLEYEINETDHFS